MNNYSIKTLIFEDSERYPILLDSEGMPHFYVTLWVTSQLRQQGKAFNTILNKINHIKLLLKWEAIEQRDLYTEFGRGQFLTSIDIEKIRDFLSKNIEEDVDDGEDEEEDEDESPDTTLIIIIVVIVIMVCIIIGAAVYIATRSSGSSVNQSSARRSAAAFQNEFFS